MAADILLYDTDIVPVGEDQRQHIEYTREMAAKFNNIFGPTFKEPKERITKEVAVIPGTDGRKMSKSYGNTIPLFGEKDEIAKAVMSIVTDSSGDKPENVFAIHKLLKSETELQDLYDSNRGSYKVLKEALIEDLESLIAPMRERRASLGESDIAITLERGAERAHEIASAKMAEVKSKIGVTL